MDDAYIAKKPCGCVTLAIVNDPERRRAVAREIAKAIRRGETVSLVPTQEVREMPWQCEAHKRKGN